MSRRVAIVAPYALSVYGGVQEQVLAMSRVLGTRGEDVLVVVPDCHDGAVYDTPASVARFGRRILVPANGSRAPLTLSPGATLKARAKLRRFRPHVVHFHEPFAPLLGWSALVAHDYPAVATFHRAGSGPALSLTKPLLSLFARRLDVAVAVSDAAAATVRDACRLECRVLFNGIETSRFTEDPRVRGDEVTVLFVGRLEERKGVATLINAVRHHSATPTWRLVVAGDGPERARLNDLAGGDERIVFLGRVSDTEKRRWLRRAHVMVAPSLHGESFGVVLLEGMAAETMVVASDLPGYRLAADGYAIFAPPGDERALAVAIKDALDGESTVRLDAARQHAERWSMTTLMDAYEEYYDEARVRFASNR